MDNAITEARRLLANLRAMRAGTAEAEEVLATLQGAPDHEALVGCLAALEEIREGLHGPLAAYVCIRLTNLQGMVNAIIDCPPPAA
ncbi:hypothetical protein [Halomonas salipaludis]|uniref:Uncharacterized protein n=1 Tax=Halomonas salipaludis TaxID=2032625 RepID=A0A2A2EP95_9GAMM|nr:hypothetical protein [Halomonas salipaludis]PAU74360.1 hypothetical protein CK498_22715 [Halomonas salipaludis]